MSEATSNCRSCDTPLPDGAMYCPRCGAATPTEIDQATGELHGATSAPPDREHRRRLQEVVGAGYRIGELLGRGGFGMVFAARDTTLERDVAIKALRPDLVTVPALIERFKREARAAAQLRHANIVPIYVVGSGEGTAYMVMPRISGESLKLLLEREGRLPVEEARRILTEAGRALAVAHEAGIVHRDVKPENILLEGPQRHVYLTDFGIAKAMGGEEEGLTATGMVVGTPSYMSPEQAGGQPHIDHRADLYSLGVVGYQMLTGKLPFAGEGLNDLIFQQISREAPRVADLRPETPPFLAAAVDRCLRRDPAERWSSAAEFVRALTTEETYVPPPARGRRWPGGSRGVAIAAATLVVIGVVATLISIQGRQEGGPEASSVATANPTAALRVPSGPTSEISDSAGRSGADTGVVENSTSSPSPPLPAPRSQSEPVAPAVRPPEPQRPAAGYLSVDAEPWGLVQIDGVDVRETPLSRHPLAPGTHEVRILRDGYVTVVDSVVVTAGNPVRRRYALIRQ